MEQRPPQGESNQRTLWGWTGFGGKTLWQWMELLIIPVVLAVGGLYFTWSQDARQIEAEDKRAQSQLEAEDKRAESQLKAEEQRAQNAALQAYLEEMGSFLMDGDLRTSQEDDEVRQVARARTLTILPRVDPAPKANVMRFLLEANLIEKDDPGPVVNLAGADLRYAALSDFPLYKTALSEANLSGADLSGADLFGADLSDAILSGAELSGAELSGADLSDATVTEEQLSTTLSLRGTIMPDGSTHD